MCEECGCLSRLSIASWALEYAFAWTNLLVSLFSGDRENSASGVLGLGGDVHFCLFGKLLREEESCISLCKGPFQKHLFLFIIVYTLIAWLFFLSYRLP